MIGALKKLRYLADLKVEKGVGHQLQPVVTDVDGCVQHGVELALK